MGAAASLQHGWQDLKQQRCGAWHMEMLCSICFQSIWPKPVLFIPHAESSASSVSFLVRTEEEKDEIQVCYRSELFICFFLLQTWSYNIPFPFPHLKYIVIAVLWRFSLAESSNKNTTHSMKKHREEKGMAPCSPDNNLPTNFADRF